MFYTAQLEDYLLNTNSKNKARANIEAIKILKEGTPLDNDTQNILSRYVGWGGLKWVFEEENPDWLEEHQGLRQLLSEEEYAQARASILNAHYTAPEIVRIMWELVRKLGFSGGNVLEPSAGIGYFLGLCPTQIREASKFMAVELDAISAEILRSLYPEATVFARGFEQVSLPEDHFDLVIGNVPFGDYSVFDGEYSHLNGLHIHNYFLGKSLALLRPGGLLVALTSTGTMQSYRDAEFREFLAERAELLAAYRLPSDTFKKNANTEVTTDLLVFQKRAKLQPQPYSLTERHWFDLVDSQICAADTTRKLPLPAYYAEHPEHLLGSLVEDKLWGGRLALAPDGRDVPQCLTQLLQELPRVYQKETHVQAVVVLPEELQDLKPLAFTEWNGGLWQRIGSTLKQVEHTRRLLDLLKLRDCLLELLQLQRTEEGDQRLASHRAQLNQLYDRFVRSFGHLNAKDNVQAFGDDPSSYLLRSLEITDDGKFKKADIFVKRTAQPYRTPDQAENAKEALLISLNEKAAVDIGLITQLTGQSVKEAVQELEEQNLIFWDPECSNWVTTEVYLSGNVRRRLEIAQREELPRNIQALLEVQPKYLLPPAPPDIKATLALAFGEDSCDLTPGATLDARLGCSWIDREDIVQFAAHLLQVPTDDIKVHYSRLIAMWTVSGGYSSGRSPHFSSTYGTQRKNALELLEAALNYQDPVVYDGKGDNSYVINHEATEAARERCNKIKQAFKAWLWTDYQRAERLTRRYNEQFNCFRLRQYDGSHLTLPGSNPDIQLRPHQLNAVWRALQERNVLLAHCVGAGKTLAQIATIMELKRLGLVKKPIWTVMNSTLPQVEAEFRRFYPNANILIPGPEDFRKENRRRLLTQIATGDWDCVILPHSQFFAIKMSREAQLEFLDQQIKLIEKAKLEDAVGGRAKELTKHLERAKRGLERRILSVANSRRKDTCIDWEQLGCDLLVVDESQVGKNLGFNTKMYGIAGIPNSNSQRAVDLFMKIQWLQVHGRGCIFATGTPISNSIVECYTLQRYLQLEKLDELGLSHFDSWVASFGETTTAPEISPVGKYVIKTRIAQYSNLPELITLYRMFADVQTPEMLNLPSPVPHFVSISAPPSPEQMAYMDELIQRSERIKNRLVSPDIDNMLKVTTDGRKSCLDSRLTNPEAENWADSKLNKMCWNIWRIWQATAAKRSTQAVFCDFSVPNGGGSFNTYTYARDVLIALGIPAREIAFIHDYDKPAARLKLFKQLNAGEVRIIFGSTSKLGTGVNIQQRLIAIHQLDAPWRPADIEQRQGRILRQGNENSEVWIFRYATEGKHDAAGFDAFLWQLLENKAKFIGQFTTGAMGLRRIEDTDVLALNYAQMKAIASGDPRIVRKATVDQEVQRLNLLVRSTEHDLTGLKIDLKRLPQRIQENQAYLARLKADLKTFEANPIQGENFRMEMGGRQYSNRKKAGESLIGEFLSIQSQQLRTTREVGSIAGFKIVIQGNGEYSPNARLAGQTTHAFTLDENSDPVGIFQTIQSRLSYIQKDIEDVQWNLNHSQTQLSNLQGQIDTLEADLKEKVALLEPLLIEQQELNQALQPVEDAAATTNEDNTQQSEEDETDRDHDCLAVQLGSGGVAAYKPPEPWLIDYLRELTQNPAWLLAIEEFCGTSIQIPVYDCPQLQSQEDPDTAANSTQPVEELVLIQQEVSMGKVIDAQVPRWDRPTPQLSLLAGGNQPTKSKSKKTKQVSPGQLSLFD